MHGWVPSAQPTWPSWSERQRWGQQTACCTGIQRRSSRASCSDQSLPTGQSAWSLRPQDSNTSERRQRSSSPPRVAKAANALLWPLFNYNCKLLTVSFHPYQVSVKRLEVLSSGWEEKHSWQSSKGNRNIQLFSCFTCPCAVNVV